MIRASIAWSEGVRELTDEEVYREVGKIVSRFDLYQCYECSRAVIQWLTENGIEGKMIELRTRYRDEDYIISDRIGSDESITINGKHYGVEVRGKVFDNLSNKGMTREQWLSDFHCQSEDFVVTEVEDKHGS
jgi:Papain fold toxin 2